MAEPRHVLVTGASSGLGAALARRLAGTGARLALTGRDSGRLADVAEECRWMGAEVAARALDVRDCGAMTAWIEQTDADAALDLVIANAGISGETGMPGDVPALARQIVETNVLGTLNTVQPVLPRMIARGAGAICVVASLSGMRGMARGPAYSGSKAAQIAMADGWHAALAPVGIRVTTACPGYVRTPLSERHSFPLPFAVSAERAAEAILAAVDRGKRRVVVPGLLAPVGWSFRALPPWATNWMIPGPPPSRLAEQGASGVGGAS